jgi:hypothetical protein
MQAEDRGAEDRSFGRTALVVAPWLVVALLLWLGFYATLPVPARGADTAPTEFSSGRAMNHIREIAKEPHPMGSAEIERVRGYLVDELENLGLEIDLQGVSVPDYFGGSGTVDIVNVIAWIPGTATSQAVLLMAHYDTVPSTPGANDNSAAVAALLETARALQAGPPLRNDIVFLFTDGEEPNPRYGANAFAELPDVMGRIGLVVNLEANGGSGASLLAETNGPESWLIDHYAAAAPHPAAFSFLTEISRLIGEIGTDFDVFKKADVPGFHFAYLRGSPIYHTPADNISSVDEGSVQHHGSHTLAIARHFGDLDLTALPGDEGSVFFTIRPLFIRYPAAWAAPLAVVAVAGFAWAISGSRRPRPVTLRGLAVAAGSSTLAMLAAAIAGTVMWAIIVALRSTPTVLESYAYFAAILAVCALGGYRLTKRIGHSRAVAIRKGWVALWVILALTTAMALPGFSYLFTWPALAAAVMMPWDTPGAGKTRRWLRFVVVAACTVLLITPAVDTTLQFTQPRPGNPDSDLTFAFALPLLLALLATALVAAVWPDRDRQVAQAASIELRHPQA